MNLEDLRKQIDKIDSDIFSMLEDRIKIVEKVKAYKNATDPNSSIIRPAREAIMVKSIFQNALDKGFSEKIALAFAVLWRNIISLSVNLEEKTTISLCSENAEVKRLAREYFGVFTKVLPEDCSQSAIKSLEQGDVSISVFEVEKKPDLECIKKPWWLHLADSTEKSGLTVFAGLPFFEAGELSTVTVAKIKPEASGKDKFVYVVDEDAGENAPAGAEVISKFDNYKLCLLDDELSTTAPKLKYLGCFAIF